MLDERKGINIGKTYVNRKQARVFIKHIAAVQRGALQSKLSETQYVAVLSDGSTDSAVLEQEILYLRICRHGKVEVHFVGMQDVEKADGESIAQPIDTIMKTVSKEWQSKLVACATDGASVMTGARRGVVSRLRGTNNHVLGIHCMAHRLELSFKDAINGGNLARQLEDLLSGLHTLYRKRAQNGANLKCCFLAIGQRPLIPTRVGGSRWVSHLLRAVDQFLRGYEGLTSQLEEVG